MKNAEIFGKMSEHSAKRLNIRNKKVIFRLHPKYSKNFTQPFAAAYLYIHHTPTQTSQSQINCILIKSYQELLKFYVYIVPQDCR